MAQDTIARERRTEQRLRELLGERDSAALTALLRTARAALLSPRGHPGA